MTGRIAFLVLLYHSALVAESVNSERFNRHNTGFTTHIERRLKEHNSGKTKSTKPYRPWKVILIEECNSRLKARHKEKYYKSGAGREKIKNLHINIPKDS